MLFRLSHKSRSVVNGVRIRLSQSIPSPSLTSHLLPYTLHARFGYFFFQRKKEKSEKLPNEKSDQETCRDSNRGLFAHRVNALPTEPQVTVCGEWSWMLMPTVNVTAQPFPSVFNKPMKLYILNLMLWKLSRCALQTNRFQMDTFLVLFSFLFHLQTKDIVIDKTHVNLSVRLKEFLQNRFGIIS